MWDIKTYSLFMMCIPAHLKYICEGVNVSAYKHKNAYIQLK